MPLLIYCVAGMAASLKGSQTGVSGSPILRLEIANLSAFVSPSADSSGWLRTPVRTAALEFHRVLRQLFSATAILPFRFPTIFEDEPELARHLERRSVEYGALLKKFSNFAQMEARVSYPDPETAIAARSGSEYLRQRQGRFQKVEEFAVELQKAAGASATEWLQRSTQSELRGFALVERDKIPEFKTNIAKARVPAGMQVRISGPWPVTEFLDFTGGLP
jgi:hypothetical protein